MGHFLSVWHLNLLPTSGKLLAQALVGLASYTSWQDQILAFPDSLAARVQVYELGSTHQGQSPQTLNQEQRWWKIHSYAGGTGTQVPGFRGQWWCKLWHLVHGSSVLAKQAQWSDSGWDPACCLAPVLQLPRNSVNYWIFPFNEFFCLYQLRLLSVTCNKKPK